MDDKREYSFFPINMNIIYKNVLYCNTYNNKHITWRSFDAEIINKKYWWILAPMNYIVKRVFYRKMFISSQFYHSFARYYTSLSLASIPLGISRNFLPYLSIICVSFVYIGVLAEISQETYTQVNSLYMYIGSSIACKAISLLYVCQENKKSVF